MSLLFSRGVLVFPVVSQLRRSALKVIYTAEPLVRSQSKVYVLDLGTAAWVSCQGVSLMQAVSMAPTAQARAIELCVYENALFERAGLAEARYTLLVGPEEFVEGARKFRFAVVKGIAFTKEAPLQKPKRRPMRPRPLPAGTIEESR
jgi:hypothetical protein